MGIDFELETVHERTVAVVDENLEGGNAGAVALRNFVVAVDPTMKPATARLFRKKLEQHFNLPVKFLFITHCHGDHVWGAAPFKDTCIVGSRVLTQNILKRKQTDWTPEAFEEWKQKEPNKADWIDEIEIFLPTLGFQQGLEIRDNDLLVELYHVGGHTSCSAYAYVPHEKVLFAGDLMFAKTFPYAGDQTCDPDRWIQIFKEFLALDFEKLVPGHGPVVGKDEVEKHLKFFQALQQATKEIIAAGKDHDAITIPEFYEPEEEDAWLKTATLEYWYTFYKHKGDEK